jgi:hypothetical protein
VGRALFRPWKEGRVAEPFPPTDERVAQLRDAAIRLTTDLDEVRLYQSAAHVAMAVDAIGREPAAAVNDNAGLTDIECYFDLDAQGWVWMYLEGDPFVLGRKAAVRKEMWRFLRVLLPGLP